MKITNVTEVKMTEERPTKEAADVWKMMKTISAYYDVEDHEEAFGCYILADAINSYTLEEFTKLFEAYEEKRKIIHVGDEIEWETVDPTKPHVGIVMTISDDNIKVLTYNVTFECFTKASINPNKVTKTGRCFADFAELFKEES